MPSVPSAWTLGAVAIALPIAVPIAAILLTFVAPDSAVWAHLRETVLLEYLLNTVALLLMVAILALLLGAGCAWLVATKEFPGRRVFAWALILPFAAPAYVVAYAYADILAYASPLQTWLRDLDLLREGLPAIRSLPGAGMVLGFTLYPYVYLLAYVAFADHAGQFTEAARTLGASPRRAFFTIALPQARPAIAGGLALTLMETAADFGVVDFFGVPTLTNGIFRTWYAQGEHQAAMQLAGWLFLIVVVLVVLEQLARRGLRANPVSRNMPPTRTRLAGWRGALASLACAVPLILGLLLPAATLLRHALISGDPSFGASFIGYVTNSVAVAMIAAVLAGLCALWLNYALRLQGEARLLRLGVRTATLGYAIPGMVLAVGLIGPLTTLDKHLAGWLDSAFGVQTGLLLTGSMAALVFVYLARFLTVAFNSLEGGMARIHPNYDSAARSLGSSPGGLLARVHLPLLTPALLTAMLLVFVDVIKELPATLILRPFNFETLATRAYRLASDERLAEASTASLMILAVGLVPTLVLAWRNFAARGSR
ncbi:MAG: iron ABC transporter permease [Gammaproteobacteria bacterium]|nr:iron ABC transporter permease [Gammaproteobacteria bacterium]MYK83016.1 iron ABC transporter permease [Gammaproteobacteria bacterium]